MNFKLGSLLPIEGYFLFHHEITPKRDTALNIYPFEIESIDKVEEILRI